MSEDTPAQRRARIARDASVAAMRERKALPADRAAVFVVRPSSTTFSWELRRYGAVVILRGTESFRSAAEARIAGEAALSALMMSEP